MKPRLIISMILDNSAAIQGEKFDNFKTAFQACLRKFAQNNPMNIDLEVIGFDEFSPVVLKSYRDEDFKCAELQPYKMPFLGKAIDLSLKDMKALIEYYNSKNVPMFKPWMFILTDAYTLDDVNYSVTAMKQFFINTKVLYMPFLLSQKKIPQNVEALMTVKSPMRIKDNCYEQFFEWFYNIAQKRAETDIDVGVKFNRSEFEGWAIL